LEFGVRQLPEELFVPPNDRLLSGILQLRGGTRKLAFRLLLHAFSDTTTDFSTEPKNVEFRERLESMGINMEPWLGDSFDFSARAGDNVPYRLFFTREMLDYLMMGFHFDTCLSPGSCNFFSTIANAIDLNKQVVYGKTDSGRILGRCLFALTDQGRILTYYRYSHDPRDGFAAAVDEFARRLAQAMNTRLASAGQVSTLVARDWYDDGAVQAESTLDLQSADGAVRKLLRTADPATLVERLRAVVGGEDALKSVIGSLLFADEIAQRPAIIPPFVEAFGRDSELAFPDRMRLAILARMADLRASSREILVSLRPNTLPSRLKRSECSSCCAFHGIGSYEEVFDLLIAHNPTLALRTIRSTRPRDVRRDTEESHRQRRRALAKIHKLLGRERLAAELAGEALHT
jgi:hypothetical protein